VTAMQASHHCGTDVPIVAHRKSRGPSLATIALDELGQA